MNKPLTNFVQTLDRAENLLNIFENGEENEDLIRSAVVFAVAGFDHYFTSKFCDVLVPFLKKERLGKSLSKLLSESGLDASMALELAVSKRPFRKIRTIVQNSLSQHTTQRISIIDELFISFGLKNLCENAEKKTGRKKLIKRISRLVDTRNDIAHSAHLNSHSKPRKVNIEDIRGLFDDLKIFVNSCDEIIEKKVGKVKPLSS